MMDDRTRTRRVEWNDPSGRPRILERSLPTVGIQLPLQRTATDEITAGYDHTNPSGEAELYYHENGTPARAEFGTTFIDLAVGRLSGIPPEPTIRVRNPG